MFYPIFVPMQLTGVIFFIFLCFSIKVTAQFNPGACIDTFAVNNNPCFGTIYDPVCGCDQITYRNFCLANAQGVQFFEQGPCEFMDFDFSPNPVATAAELKLTVITKGLTDINVWIFDTFFKQRYYQVYRQFQDVELFPDVRNFGNGLYFIVVEAQGTVKVKRLLVNQINP